MSKRRYLKLLVDAEDPFSASVIDTETGEAIQNVCRITYETDNDKVRLGEAVIHLEMLAVEIDAEGVEHHPSMGECHACEGSSHHKRAGLVFCDTCWSMVESGEIVVNWDTDDFVGSEPINPTLDRKIGSPMTETVPHEYTGEQDEDGNDIYEKPEGSGS